MPHYTVSNWHAFENTPNNVTNSSNLIYNLKNHQFTCKVLAHALLPNFDTKKIPKIRIDLVKV